MKKILTIGVAIIVFSLTLYLILLTFHKPNGKVNKAKIDYGSSVKFDETELKSAVNCVLTKFKEYKGCNLLNLWYDEEKPDHYLEKHFSNNNGNYSKEDIIGLYSDFKVNFTGGVGGSFNPNSTYNNWGWILTRDSKTDSFIVGILSRKRKNEGLFKIISNISLVGSSILSPIVITGEIFIIAELLGYTVRIGPG